MSDDAVNHSVLTDFLIDADDNHEADAADAADADVNDAVAVSTREHSQNSGGGGAVVVDDRATTAPSAVNRLIMSRVDLQRLFDWENAMTRCALCSAMFREITNIGVWTCTQHVGTFEIDVWTCCWQRGMRARGCVRSHHKATPGPYSAATQWLKLSHSMLKHVASRVHERTLYECDVRDGITVGSSFKVLRYDTAGETFVLTARRCPTRHEITQLDAYAHETAP